jgi:membrane associated rhomboid family serine protease
MNLVNPTKPLFSQLSKAHREVNSMSVRIILKTLAMAYGGFLWAGRGTQSLNSISITGALIGALTGLLLAIMFNRRARRKQT